MDNKIIKRKFNKKKVRSDYDHLAGHYDLWSKLTETRAINKAIELAEINNRQHVLEVAVGTGLAFRKIAHLNPDGMNIGIDLSKGMLKKTEKRMKGFSKDHYLLQLGNAYHLPFKDQSFDVLINNYMLDLLPEKDFEMILSEFYRVLKPGGRVTICSFSFGTKKINKIWFWMAEKFPELLKGCRPISLESYLKRAGFRVSSSEEVSQNTFPSMVLKGIKTDR